ncbi:MAG TPA: PQQ-binding-like beta-propeller repeat protein [Thermoanaerobaculales bacterium]|nr:PQQ-binding-like beta-propeller repeat protein [Thermoanaerobaculales bacterium]HQN97465.1 PQQ-binding-like beta-propeller repeat protein [Thermoanaerobaculales bacterium]HQP44161.1 PQQ-binding-like beta-propeller repeat protein [Thermoanaerobaculales bacterium]
MRPAQIITLVAFFVVVAVTVPAVADEGDGSMTARLQARAEAPPSPAVERPDLEGLTVPDRLFYMRATDHIRCVRAIADVTGDGRDEVIVGVDESQADNIFCLDGASSDEATVVWAQHPISGASNGSPYHESIVPVSDPDGNGYQNLLVGTVWGGRSAHNLDGFAGDILWTFDTYLEPESGWVYSLAELNDITGDGVPEVAFGAGSYNDTIYLVDGASSLPGQATVIWQRQMLDAVVSVQNLGDVDGDGDHDVLLAVGDSGYKVVCMSGGSTNPSGTILWEYPTGSRSAYAVGVLPDITGDGINEALAVLWATGGSSIRCLNGATGSLVWSSTQVSDYGMMVDVLEDVTGDGHDEVIVASWENAVIVLNGLTGGQVWKTPVGTLNGGDVWYVHSIDDLNADGLQDVVAGSFDTYAYAMSGADGTVLWSFPTGNRVYSIYPVGDLNADGTPEVAVGNQNLSGSLLEVVHVLDGSDIPGVPDFTLSADPGSVQICAGESAEYTVDVGAVSGFSSPVNLAATGNPAGSTTAFVPNPVTPPGASQLFIGDTGGAAAGTYTVTISGTASGSPGHTVDVTLDVVVPAPPPALTAPPNGAPDQPLRPTFQWTAAAGAATYWLEVDDDPAFASPAIDEPGIAATSFTPAGDLDAETTYDWRVRSENLCGPGAASTVFTFTTEGLMPFADGFESGDTSAWSATVP